MPLTINIPPSLEHELSAEAERLGLPLPEYALRVLAVRRTGAANDAPLTGADLVAFWQAEGLIGARPEIADAQAHARQLRHRAERRTRA